jgi:hypothetical protein
MLSQIRYTKYMCCLMAAVVLLLGIVDSIPAGAQVAGGTILGTITDASGGVIPNAQVSIKNVATGVSRTVTTNSEGFYTAPNLLPGNYEVRATAKGFSTEVESGIALNVGAVQVVNLAMKVGTTSETVQVTTEAPTVELASSEISAVVNATTVRELPLNGRSWTDLATLTPGVAAVQTQAAIGFSGARGNRGFGSQIAVAGARPQENNYRLDGISINDYANSAPGSVLGGDLGVDAIGEFSVITSNYSSEYGRTSGGVVNAITRSGTNQFHGGAYEFLRNSALDAKNFFDVGKIPPFRRNQFGADAGGPIRKDKVFVFGDYEGIRQSKGFTKVDTVPSPAARGIGPDGKPTVARLCLVPAGSPPGTPCTPNSPLPANGPPGTNPDPATHIDTAVEKYLPFWPLPNGGIKPGTNGDIAFFTFATPQVVREDFGTARVDAKISAKDSLAATYLGDITPVTLPSDLDAVLITTKTNRQIGILEETHTFSPILVNSTRIGYSRDAVVNFEGISAINPLASDPSLAAIPGQFAAQVNASGLSPLIGGVGSATVSFYYWDSFQAYDDAFWTHGTHSIKFGGGVERMQLNQHRATDPGGIFTFPNLYKFLTNQPQRFDAFLTPAAVRGFRQTLFGLYIQDDWRARPSLTLNFGLRWEMTTVPTEVHAHLSNLINITDGTPHLGSPYYSNATLGNFDPRVGFSWDPFHSGKTAVRGGFGIFDALPLPYLLTQTPGFPFENLGNAVNLMPGTFYTGVTALNPGGSPTVNFIEQHPHRSYAMQWNLNVQRELLPNLTALVGYVGSGGVHLPVRLDDGDFVFPARRTSQGYVYPAPISSTNPTINPNFGDIQSTFFAGHSSYHALEVGLQKRMSHGVQVQGSFTWGRSIDDGSASTYGNQFTNSISSLPWYDRKSVRGLSDFNIGRTLVINGTWDIPGLKSASGPLAWVANGWELGGIFKVNDGTPFTATFGTAGDPQGLNSSDPWAFPNRLTGPGCGTLVNPGNPNNYIKTECFDLPKAPSMAFWQANCDTTSPIYGPNLTTEPFPVCFNLRGNAGRNILIGPGLTNLDFSVFKNNRVKRISENFNVQFRAEFFNVLNHPNFAVPVTPDNTDIFDPTGVPTGVAGLLTSTTTTAREIQFALKLSW